MIYDDLRIIILFFGEFFNVDIEVVSLLSVNKSYLLEVKVCWNEFGLYCCMDLVFLEWEWFVVCVGVVICGSERWGMGMMVFGKIWELRVEVIRECVFLRVRKVVVFCLVWVIDERKVRVVDEVWKGLRSDLMFGLWSEWRKSWIWLLNIVECWYNGV